MVTDSNANSGLTSRVATAIDSRIATYLIIAGLVLFVLPEPITSVIGILVLGIGLVAWAISYFI